MRLNALTLLMLLVPAAATAQQEPVTGSWTARFRPDRANIQLAVQFDDSRSNYGSSTYGFTVDAAELKNLSRTNDASGFTRVAFSLIREAGTLTFEGRGDDARGSGWFRFEPSQAYVRQM